MKFKTQNSKFECRNDAVDGGAKEPLGMKKMLLGAAFGTAVGIVSGVVANAVTDRLRRNADHSEVSEKKATKNA
jgi:hypothetical protein